MMNIKTHERGYKYHSEHIIVIVKSDVDLKPLHKLLHRYGAKIESRIHGINTMKVVVDSKVMEDLRAEIAKCSCVDHADHNTLLEFFDTGPIVDPSNALFYAQMNFMDMNVARAWGITKGSPDIWVGVLDSGVDLSHPAFAGQLVPSQYINGLDAWGPDVDSHGTMCGGMVVAKEGPGRWPVGVAPACKLAAFKPNPQGILYQYDTAAVLTAVAQSGSSVRVMSCSWGSPIHDSSEFGPLNNGLRLAIDLCWENNILVCVAAGNTGTQISTGLVYNSTYGFWYYENANSPANLTNVLTVGGSASEYKFLHPGSSRGPVIDICAPYEVTTCTPISIPNQVIYDAGRGYRLYRTGGTSAATPQIAGVAGLVLSVNPLLTKAEVFDIIKNTANASLMADEIVGHYGAGVADAYAAVQAAWETRAVPAYRPLAPSGLQVLETTVDSFILGWDVGSGSNECVSEGGFVLGGSAVVTHPSTLQVSSVGGFLCGTSSTIAGGVSAAGGFRCGGSSTIAGGVSAAGGFVAAGSATVSRGASTASTGGCVARPSSEVTYHSASGASQQLAVESTGGFIFAGAAAAAAGRSVEAAGGFVLSSAPVIDFHIETPPASLSVESQGGFILFGYATTDYARGSPSINKVAFILKGPNGTTYPFYVKAA